MSASAEMAMRTVLLTSTGLTDLVSTRIHPHSGAQGQSLPIGIYQRITGTHMHHLNTSDRKVSGLMRAQIQLDWYSTGYNEIVNIAELSRLALDGYSGTVAVSGEGNVVVKSILLQDDATEYDEPQSGEEIGVWRARQDWTLVCEESAPST